MYMKKAWVILVALAMLAIAVPSFADVAIKGQLLVTGNTDFATATGALNRARVKLDVKVDDNNSVYVELRGEDGKATWGTNDFNLKNFKLTSNLTKAMGLDLPVGVTLTMGRWDEYFTGWFYNSPSGFEFYYDWPNMLINQAENTVGAFKFDVAVSPVTLHYWSDSSFTNMMIGADASVAGFSAWLAYGATYAAPAAGIVAVELKYALPEMGDLKANLAPYFRYNLAAAASPSYTYGASVGVDYTMIHFDAGLQGDSVQMAHRVVVDASVAPVAAAKIGASVYVDLANANALQGIDLNASYAFGGTKVFVGYVVPGTDKNAISLWGDTFAYSNGLYFGADVSF